MPIFLYEILLNYDTYQSGIMLGCNFFIWGIEDVGDDRNAIIARQRNKIYNLGKHLKVSTKWIQMLLVVVYFVVVINIIMLSMLLKYREKCLLFWNCDVMTLSNLQFKQ